MGKHHKNDAEKLYIDRKEQFKKKKKREEYCHQ